MNIHVTNAERIDTLKVVETLPDAYTLEHIDTSSYNGSWVIGEPLLHTGETTFVPSNVSILGFPGNTYAADLTYAFIEFDTMAPIDRTNSSKFSYMDTYFYFKPKTSGTLYVGYRFSITLYDSSTGDTATYTETDLIEQSISISSSSFDSDGRLIALIRLSVRWSTSLSETQIRLGVVYFDVSTGTYVAELGTSVSLGSSVITPDYLIYYRLEIDYLRFERSQITLYSTVDHISRENDILHHIRVPSYSYGSSITVYKPSEWSFYNITPSATVTEYSDRIEITDTIEGDYDIYFTSTDFWNYPRRYDTRISYFDQKGDFIPFESVFTYYNLSWSTVSSPTYEPLYSDVFTMDPAQYLSIKVLDRWGNTLLEETNLEYQEFYNFTITMYTLQVYNFQDDFIYVKVRKSGATDWYGQYLAPYDALLLRLYPTTYDLQVTLPNSTTLSETVSLTNDTTYLVSGWTLSKIVGIVSRTAVRYFDQKGNYLPFEQFFTYYNISDVELSVEPTWNSLYFDNFLMRRNQYLNIKVYDRWNSLLLDKRNMTYREFFNFTITMYSWKLINFQDDFVYMQLKRAEASNWYTEWIAPGEIEEEFLAPGWYNLTIQFKNGTEIHEDFYLNTDATYIVEGWTLRKLAGRVDINFSHLLPISLRNNYTNEEIPMRYVVLYVNGYQSSDRVLYIEGNWANITVYDVFNHLLADKRYNVTEVGWVNIGLNVTHLVLKNPYEIYGVRIALTSQSTSASRTYYVPPLETINIFVANDTYNYIVDLMDPSFTDVKRTVQGSFIIETGQVEYIILFGWNIFPDAYMHVNFVGETGTINLVCEIMIYMNYSKIPIPSVYLEAYVNNTLAGTGWTDSQGRAAIVLDRPLNGVGTLTIKASKLGVTRWYNTTYNIWGWMVIEEPPMIVQGEVGTYNLIFSNPSRVGDTPIKIENATVIFRVYGENTTTPFIVINKTTIDIPAGSSQFTFTLNTTSLLPGGYILEIEVIYANSTFAKKQIPFTVTPKPEYRIILPWWLIIVILLIVFAASLAAWLIIQWTTRRKMVQRLHGKPIIRPRGVEKQLSS